MRNARLFSFNKFVIRFEVDYFKLIGPKCTWLGKNVFETQPFISDANK